MSRWPIVRHISLSKGPSSRMVVDEWMANAIVQHISLSKGLWTGIILQIMTLKLVPMIIIIPVVFLAYRLLRISGLYPLNVILNNYRYPISNPKLMMMVIIVVLPIECIILLALFWHFILEYKYVGSFQSSLGYMNAFLI